MTKPDFDFDDAGSGDSELAGTPEGDGDFQTDQLPDTGATAAGGQVLPKRGNPADAALGHSEPADSSEKAKISHSKVL